MVNNTLNNIANINAHSGTITPGITRIIEISMVNAIIPSIILFTGINHCRTVVTTITTTVVGIIATTTMIASNTIIIIIASTSLLLLLLRTFLYKY